MRNYNKSDVANATLSFKFCDMERDSNDGNSTKYFTLSTNWTGSNPTNYMYDLNACVGYMPYNTFNYASGYNGSHDAAIITEDYNSTTA